MADKKISQLTALSAVNLAPSTDVLAIVDTSATETKKIVAQDLVNGVLNVASAVGIGTASPAAKLDVAGGITATTSSPTTAITLKTPDNVGQIGFWSTTSSTQRYAIYLASGTNWTLRDTPASADRLILDSSGNLGLGVTPSAWASGNRFIDVNASASYGAFGNTDAMMLANAFWNGSNWIRKNDGNAFRFVIESVSTAPTINWQVAANSTAGSTISFTQALTLDADGNLLLGTTSLGTTFGATAGVLKQTGGVFTDRTQITVSGGTTTTMFTLANASNNQTYLISARQSGSQNNFVLAFVTAYAGNALAARIVQSNAGGGSTDMNVTVSGLAIQLVLGAGFGSTTWDCVLTRIG
jgi:hypothetical protein